MKLGPRQTIGIETKKLHDFITCQICQGILIQPHAITECMHSFCRECIESLKEPNSVCPVCDIDLGPHPDQSICADPVLESIIFKLIPGLLERVQKVQEKCKKQKIDEIKVKKEALPFTVVVDQKWVKEQEVMIPDDLKDQLHQLPILKVEFDTTIAKIKVFFLNQKNLGKRIKGIVVLDIYCGDVHLGDEWSLEYCSKLAWFSNDPIELLIRPILE